MARLERNEGKPDSELDLKTICALTAWMNRDYRNPNWWWNEIGVPELVGEIGTLMQPELSSGEASKVVEIMKRSDWRKVPWAGANLIWSVEIEIVRGCLESDPTTVAEGYERMYQAIKIVGPKEEGIQIDGSFHQHGARLNSAATDLFMPMTREGLLLFPGARAFSAPLIAWRFSVPIYWMANVG
jgi:chondroitin AC lyase